MSGYHIEEHFDNVINPIIFNLQQKFVPVTFGTPKTNVILRKDETKHNLVKLLHGTMCSPVKSTWLKAIKNKKK